MHQERGLNSEGYLEPRNIHKELAQEVFSRVETVFFEEDPVEREDFLDSFIVELLNRYESHCLPEEAKKIIKDKYNVLVENIKNDSLDESIPPEVLERVGKDIFQELKLVEKQ